MWFFLLNLIFPEFCVSCGHLGSLLCPRCYERLAFHPLPLPIQLENLSLDQVQAVCHYQAPMTQLIHTFKYQSVKNIGRLLANIVYHTTALPDVDCLTAVPLHPRRQDERGYNQAELIARYLAKLLHKPYLSILTRTHYSAAQATIQNRDLRLKRLRATFALNQKDQSSSPQNSILLIDDVLTTGSTLNECARILKQHGWKKVYGLVMAHGG